MFLKKNINKNNLSNMAGLHLKDFQFSEPFCNSGGTKCSTCNLFVANSFQNLDLLPALSHPVYMKFRATNFI